MAALAVALSGAVGCGDDGSSGMPDGGPPPTCEDGELTDGETDVDCGGVCGGCAVREACEVDTDCLSMICRIGTCRQAVTCDDGELTAGETDVDCGGAACLPCNLGDACIEDTDCTTGNCNEGVCIAECDDGILNGSETALDCGGNCAGCPDGEACEIPSDCASGLCVDDMCDQPSCDDGIRNGSETDVDCGGDECAACPGGGACEEGDDCETRTCQMGMCAATTCVNGLLDDDESDVDCGGPECNGCLPGDSCNDSDDCIGSVCDAGVCTTATTCLGLFAIDPELESGVYTIEPEAGEPVQVYCDMETDGGGWTLVGSSANQPPADVGERYFPELATLSPDFNTRGIWDGLRQFSGRTNDIRFACRRQITSDEFDVDIAFYNADYYDRITASQFESQTCFNAADDESFQQPPPARRNLLTGEFRRSTDAFDSRGTLRGEETCDDGGDFTVDFDDGGIGGEIDGTDWGQVDRNKRCGAVGFGGGAFFVFARESNPRCVNGVQDGDETGIDCGGECGGCGVADACVLDGDCASYFCDPDASVCIDTCGDEVRQFGETDVDCGGICDATCEVREMCRADDDCDATLGCLGGFCLGTHCDNATQDGNESDRDCGGDCFLCDLNQMCFTTADCAIGTCNDENVCFAPLSCQDVLSTNPGAASGVYVINNNDELFDVYCDMDADGGGWTLVGSNGVPLVDEGENYYADLSRELSSSFTANRGVWNGFRDLYSDNTDIRFSCRLSRASGAANTVDLSFYDVDWYRKITASTSDSGTCFFEGGDLSVSPERRNNVAGTTLPLGDRWNSGVLEGEDFCGDFGDFTVDFDDRGMDSNQRDGTDWGDDDSQHKCGTISGFSTGQWSIWIRPVRGDDD